MWEAYGTRSSVKAVQAGVPDFFVYKCVNTFLFQHDLELQYVIIISVLRADNLNVVTYRYEGDFKDAEIRLLYNGNPTKGHYSPIGECEKNLNYTSNDINAVVFTCNYRKRIDLDERLKRCDSIWNLDNEKKIFTKTRGYNFVEEDKEEERDDSKKKKRW